MGQEAAIERALFDRALDSFEPTLHAASDCINAIMVFVAGMTCFSCNPNWDQFVWRGITGDVTAVNVGGESCIYVADHCGPFGHAMQPLRSVAVHVASNATEMQSRKLFSNDNGSELMGHVHRSLSSLTQEARPYPSRPLATLDP